MSPARLRPAPRGAPPFRGERNTTRGEIDKVETRSPNRPGYRRWVDAEKHAVMRKALLAFFPKRPPGKTQAEMQTMARRVAPRLFGGTSGWWSKCVQLDLEAKGELVRDRTRPLTWRRAR